MADKYTFQDEQSTMSSSYKTASAVEGVTTSRARIYDLLMGITGTPADNNIEWLVDRSSTTGTRTAGTETELDLDGPAALLGVGGNHTVEGSAISNSTLVGTSVNDRVAFRLILPPGGEIIVPATANSCVRIKAQDATYASTFMGQIWWEE